LTELNAQPPDSVNGFETSSRKCNTAPGIFFIAFLFFVMLMPHDLAAQEKKHEKKQPDTTLTHSAKKAAIMSAVLPGLGQAYNKKYWKIPIIYAGFGILSYFIVKNGREYRNFRTAYNIVATGDSANFDNEYVVRYNGNLDQLQEGRNYYRRNLNLSYILTGALYILNIIDASVDASLYDFDVSDDLSLRFDPVSDQPFITWKPVPAITLRYKF